MRDFYGARTGSLGGHPDVNEQEPKGSLSPGGSTMGDKSSGRSPQADDQINQVWHPIHPSLKVVKQYAEA
jgi:hypothetical protein